MKPRVEKYGIVWSCVFNGERRLFVRQSLERSWTDAVKYALTLGQIIEISDELAAAHFGGAKFVHIGPGVASEAESWN